MKWINEWLRCLLTATLVVGGFQLYGQTFTNRAAVLNVDLDGSKDGGLCWADFNNDGFLDLVVNTNDNTRTSKLYYWNSGTSQFDDVTAARVSTAFADRRERSALAGDFDNDGDLDFMRSTSIQLEIYENSGAPNYDLNLLQEYTSGTAPFDGTTQNGMNNEGLAWMDFDGDGDLDVYMEDHQYGQDILEYNQVSGLFEHYTPDGDTKGFPSNGSSGDYSVTADLDNDGSIDIVARRQGTNTIFPTDERGYDIYFNDADGTFSFNNSINLQTENGYKGGVAVADFDNDGDFDFMWTNHNDGTGTRHVIVAEQTGLNSRVFQQATVTVTAGTTGSLTSLPNEDIEGIGMADINNDGKIDVFLAADLGPSYLLVNTNTGGNFSFEHENYGIDVDEDGEGVAFADYDSDGDMDFYLNINGGNNQLWENDLGGNADYLKVEPLVDLGAGVTRPAIGATVVIDEEGCSSLKFIQEVSGGVGHGAQNDSKLHFGLPNGPNLRYKVTVSFVKPNGGTRTVVEKYVTPSALAGQTLQVLNTDTSDPDATPSPTDDSYTVTMNSVNNPLDVLANDTDPNGENLSINLPSGSTTNGGTVVVNNNGTPADPTDDFIDYTPANGYSGVDNFIYEAINVSLFCASATVDLIVNAPPTGGDHTVSTPEDVTYVFAISDFTQGYNDADSDPFAEIRITSLESVGSLLYNGNPVTLNQVISATDIGNNLLTFVPVANQNGSPYDNFDFEVGDGTDFSTADYTLTINVTAVNDGPVGSDNTVSTTEDITYTFSTADFTVGYADPEGDAFAEIRISSLESVGNLLYNGNPVTLNQVISATDIGNSLLTFVPIGNQNGSPYDSFDFEVGDGTDFSVLDYTLTVNVTPVNDAPTSSNNTVSTPEDVTFIFSTGDFTVGYNDIEGSALAEIRITSLESVGSLLYNGNPVTLNQIISATDIGNNLLTFVPVANQSGSPYDNFDFEVGDGTDFSVTDYTLTINVTPTNDPPIGSDNVITTTEDITYTFSTADFTVGYSDPEGNPFVEIRITSLESVGSLLYNGNPVTLNQVISATDIGNNLLTFVPVSNQSGSPYDSFDFEVGDGTNFSNVDYTLTVNVTPVNDAPTSSNNTVSTQEDVTYTFGNGDFTVGYSDPEGDPFAEIRITSLESVGSLLYNGNPVTLNQVISATDIGNNLLTFVPVAGQNGSPYDSFDFEVGDGTVFSATDYTITVNVTPRNDPPVGNDNAVTTPEDVTYVFTVADFTVGYSDPEGNPLAEIRITSLESAGSLLYNGNPVTLNQVISATDIGNNLLTFVPLANQSGSPYDSFDFEVGDGLNYSTLDYTLTINVTALNDVPSAQDDNANTNEDIAVNITILTNDNLGDPPTSITALDGITTQGGTASINDNGTPADGSDDFITYTPPPGFSGNDSFTYTIQDIDGESSTATVFVSIANVNDQPIAVDDIASTTENVALPIDVLSNDDLGDTPTFISSIDGATSQGGTAVINNNGTPADTSDDFVDYTPANGFSGTDTFTYTIEDVDGETSTATVSIMVNALGNNSPSAVNDTYNTNVNTVLAITAPGLLINDSDVDADPLSVSAFDMTSANGGNVLVNGDGSFTYTPPLGFSGVDNFTYTISDGRGGTATATVTVNVQTGINNPPVVVDINLSTIVNLGFSFTDTDFINAFTDADGDALNHIEILSLPNDGTLLLSGTPVVIGQIIAVSDIPNLFFTPNPSFTGIISFQWTANDGKENATVPANVVINIPFDSDGDGIPDEDEIDGDPNDPRDTDMDGDPDYLDPDSDDDGIPDDEEAGDDPENPVDTDMDGVPDYIDPDSDGDSKLDEDEGIEDCDLDGIANYLDPDDDCEALTIYKGFSPNGDGNNDQWVIDGILLFPDNTVRVFNRWGNLVYEEDGYDNQSKVWFGQTNKGIVLGKKDLPDGTYFYMVELGDGSESRSGYVMLKR